VTRWCRPFPQLVGADYWLPLEPFEFGWATAVGCNNLYCEHCRERVCSEGRPGGFVRRYWCGCREHFETWTYWIGGEPEDLYPAFTGWECGGHQQLALPTVLDGVPLDAETDWRAVAADAILQPPFHPPGIDLQVVWLLRLFRLLNAEQPLLSRAVATLLDAADRRLVRGALDFFLYERTAAGAERITGMVIERQTWLSETPDPREPSCSMLDSASSLLHARLLDVDNAGDPVDRPALALAKELAVAGVGPRSAPLTFSNCDPEWLWANAGRLVRAKEAWADMVVYVAIRASATIRTQVLRDIAAIAPDAVRAGIVNRIREPERQELLSSLWP
jgi:hypothetical protein